MQIIETTKAPKAIGAYSQAIISQGMVFTSGQIPLDAESGEVVGDSIEVQTQKVLENLREVLVAANSGFDQVIKTTIFLTDMANFPVVNQMYAEAMNGHKPARSTVAVAALPKSVKIEIEMIAKCLK